MQINFLDVLISVISLLVLILPGFILVKTKLLKEGAMDACSTIVLYGCQPVLMFMCFQNSEYSSRIGLNMLYAFILAIVAHLVMILIVRFCVKGENETRVKVMRYASVFGNCGFMGIPFIQTLFSSSPILSEILIYAAVVNSAFNILNWTAGVYIMTGDKTQISAKKILLNPVIIATVLGAILFFAIKRPIVSLCAVGTVGYSFVEKITSSLDLVADMVTPLSMFVIGMRLATVKLSSVFMQKTAYVVSALKLILSAVVTMLVVIFLPISQEVKCVIFLLLAMPTAASGALFAIRFNQDADFASICVLQSTLLSIITIPLTFLMFSALLAVI